MNKKTKTTDLSHIRSLNELHRQQKRMQHQIEVQEQNILIDTNNIQATFNIAIDLIHKVKDTVTAIKPTLSYLSGGLRIARLLFRRRRTSEQ